MMSILVSICNGNADLFDTNSNIQVTRKVDKIQIGDAVTGRVSSRPKD